MNIKLDRQEFETRQTALSKLLAAGIREHFEALGLGTDEDEELDGL